MIKVEGDMKHEHKRQAGDGRLKVNAMVRHLVDEGWNEWPNPFERTARCFYKRFKTPTRCHLNDDRDGMQVQISLYTEHSVGYEMRLDGELSDGTWIEFHQWSLPENIEDGIALIPRLLQTWEFMSNVTVEAE